MVSLKICWGQLGAYYCPCVVPQKDWKIEDAVSLLL